MKKISEKNQEKVDSIDLLLPLCPDTNINLNKTNKNEKIIYLIICCSCNEYCCLRTKR